MAHSTTVNRNSFALLSEVSLIHEYKIWYYFQARCDWTNHNPIGRIKNGDDILCQSANQLQKKNSTKCGWQQRRCTVCLKFTSKHNNFYPQCLRDAAMTCFSSSVAAGDDPLPIQSARQCPLDTLSKHLALTGLFPVLCFVVLQDQLASQNKCKNCYQNNIGKVVGCSKISETLAVDLESWWRCHSQTQLPHHPSRVNLTFPCDQLLS